MDGKKAELSQYFSNLVWEFATTEEGLRAERRGGAITARWVLTWKKIDHEDGSVRRKARLVLRGFEDPDVLTLDKANPPCTGRMNEMDHLRRCSCSIPFWEELCP